MSGMSMPSGSDNVICFSADELEAASALLLLGGGNTIADQIEIQDSGPSDPRSKRDGRESRKKDKIVPNAPKPQPQGINFYKRIGRWTGHIWAEGKQHYIGSFSTATEAARAYDKAILKLCPEKISQLNFERSEYILDIDEMAKFTNMQYREHLRSCAKQSRLPNVAEGVTLCPKGWYEVKIRRDPLPEEKRAEQALPRGVAPKAPPAKWKFLGKFRNLADAKRCYQSATKKP